METSPVSMKVMVWFGLLPSVMLAAGCHKHDHGGGPTADEYVVDCETTGGNGGASDENFVAFVNAAAAGKVTTNDAQAPRLMSPLPGTVLSATTPPTVTFMVPQAANAAPASRRHMARACGVDRERAGWATTAARAALRSLSPIGTAHAHCPAFTGENYLFELANQTGAAPAHVYTAVLSVDSFTPAAAIWRKAMEGRAGQTLVLSLQRAVFFKGSIMEGPFVPQQEITFTVGP